MPVEFVTEEQEVQYGQFTGDPPDEELVKYFYLDGDDWQLLVKRRGDHNRLGFALQLGAVRYLGVFLSEVQTTPTAIVTYLAQQLQIKDAAACLEQYQRSEMRLDHTKEIAEQRGYHDFSDGEATFPFVRMLYLRAWLSAERPSVLFDIAAQWLLDHKILLPGITVLARFISHVRDRVAERVWARLVGSVTDEQRVHLEMLLAIPEKQRYSTLDRLRQGPTRTSAPALVRALKRVEELRQIGVGEVDLAGIPANRLKALATYAITSRAQAIERLAPERRTATLLAFARHMELRACDDAVDVLDQLLRDLFAGAEKTGKKERLRTLKDLDAAALLLADYDTTLLAQTDWTLQDFQAFLTQHRERMTGAIETITDLARPPDDQYHQELRAKKQTLRRFLPTLLRTIEFGAIASHQPLMEAWDYLKRIEGEKRPTMADAPMAVIPDSWRATVAPPGQQTDRTMYTICILHLMQAALKRRDVYVPQSQRYADPRAKLLHGPAWEAARPGASQLLGRSLDAATEIATWARELDAAYHSALTLVPNVQVTTQSVKDEQGKTHEELVVTPLDEIPETPTLILARDYLKRRMPVIDLSAIILEIQHRTGFAREFTHISEGSARVEDFPLSLSAVLLAKACNVPLTAVMMPNIPALDRDRLQWVEQNYVRPETIARANSRLVEYQWQCRDGHPT